MINLNFYKKKYFSDKIFISSSELLDHFRNTGIQNNLMINDLNINYKNYDPIDLFKILSDKVLFYKVESSSIKNMLYANKLFYQVFEKECQIESYLYRVINEKVNRMLIFTGNFSNKNNTKLISLEQKEELINNINNDIIYLSDNIILIRYQVFLPWLWKCRSNPIEQLDNLKVTKYYLQNKWNFSNE
jgi:hypothetical protein